MRISFTSIFILIIIILLAASLFFTIRVVDYKSPAGKNQEKVIIKPGGSVKIECIKGGRKAIDV